VHVSIPSHRHSVGTDGPTDRVPEVGNIRRSAKRPRADEALGRDGTKLYGLINRRAPRWRNGWRESSRRGLLVGADRVVEQGLATSPINPW